MTAVLIIGLGEAMLSDFLLYMGVLAVQAVLFVAAGSVPWILLLCTLFVAWIRKDATRTKRLVRANILLALAVGCATLALQNDTLTAMTMVGYGLTVSLLAVLCPMRLMGLALSKLFQRGRVQEVYVHET